MGRYWNLESAAVLGLCFAIAAGVCLLVGLTPVKALSLAFICALLIFFPLATAVQDKLIEIYARHGKLDRALVLAISARESAPNGRIRNRALVDVALLHLRNRDYPNALKNLERVRSALVNSDVARAVVQGHLAYCLAHLEQDLERAEELARSAVKGAPDEPIFGYFLGLVLLQRGNAAEAEPLIAASLEQDPDPTEPFPGERGWALARARLALGQDCESARGLALAAGGHFAELARALGSPGTEPAGAGTGG